jgi:hypothetical protein
MNSIVAPGLDAAEVAELTAATDCAFTPERIAAEEGPARFKERQSITAYIRNRAASAIKISKRSGDRLPEVEATRLKRWLDQLAEDIDAQLHDDDPRELD